MSTNITIIGIQWGDEGKAKIIDSFCDSADYVVRFNGGPNAGHTVIVNDQKYVFHCVPSGILYPNVTCIIGPGTVLDPEALIKEITDLQNRGIKIAPHNLKISGLAHLIFPEHKERDAQNEQTSQAIGTTKRGIGPCYADKMARKGVRILDLLSGSIKDLPTSLNFIEALYKFRDFIAPFVADTQKILLAAIQAKKKILFEGAQGLMLDIDHGTYPFVTSSTTHPANAASSNGIPIKSIGEIWGISKGYVTRVGGGPFPTELKDEIGETIRAVGKEFGSTTGRPRRVGWLDLVQLEYATKMSGTSHMVLTKLDVLAGHKELKICTKYTDDKYSVDAGINWSKAKPEYVTLPGFPVQNWSEITTWQQLSTEMKRYIAFIENHLGVPIMYVSLGPERKSLLPTWRLQRPTSSEALELLPLAGI